MKQFIFTLLTPVLLLGALSACGTSAGAPAAETQEEAPLKIVATIFPEYDWVRQLLGDQADRAELTLLLDSGVDLHSYQPTAQDLLTISNCDLFLYVGGESDGWVEEALQAAPNPNRKVIALLPLLGDGAKTEETVEGMEAEAHDHEGEEGPAYDEHVWLSLRNAQVFCQAIADALGQLDPENQALYAGNGAAYLEELKALDQDYQAAVSAARQNTLLFGDRFPFRYLTEDYGLTYYAAFSGCSAETEASFETIAFLAGKVDQLGLNSILTLEAPAHTIAETIRQNTRTKDQQILALDSMQSTTAQEASAGATYLSIMEDNLAVLREALG